VLIEPQSLGALILATAALVAIPGPNVALIVANSLAFGRRVGLATVAGTTLGVGVQLALIVIGFAVLVELVANVLHWIKWAGVIYLLYLAFVTWRLPDDDPIERSSQETSLKRLFWSGFAIALINPKTLLFNAAFIPQFVSDSANPASQLFLLSAVYLTVIAIGDSLWVAAAGAARHVIVRFGRIKNRITASIYLVAGGSLAIAHKS